jgi:hypothetical protein
MMTVVTRPTSGVASDRERSAAMHDRETTRSR